MYRPTAPADGIDRARFPHAVPVTFPDRDAYQALKDWCADRPFEASPMWGTGFQPFGGPPVPPKEYHATFRFEREEDAALFKLFHGGA